MSRCKYLVSMRKLCWTWKWTHLSGLQEVTVSPLIEVWWYTADPLLLSQGSWVQDKMGATISTDWMDLQLSLRSLLNLSAVQCSNVLFIISDYFWFTSNLWTIHRQQTTDNRQQTTDNRQKTTARCPQHPKTPNPKSPTKCQKIPPTHTRKLLNSQYPTSGIVTVFERALILAMRSDTRFINLSPTGVCLSICANNSGL